MFPKRIPFVWVVGHGPNFLVAIGEFVENGIPDELAGASPRKVAHVFGFIDPGLCFFSSFLFVFLGLFRSDDEDIPKYVEENEGLFDFYDQYDKFEVSDEDRKKFHDQIEKLTPKERAILRANKRFTVVNFENKGGALMPLLVELHLKGGKKVLKTIPAEIWKKDHQQISKMFVTDKPVVKVVLDPRKETADAELRNNVWPPAIGKEAYSLFQDKKGGGGNNPMKTARKKEEAAKKKLEEEKKQKEAEKKKASETPKPEKKEEATKPK